MNDKMTMLGDWAPPNPSPRTLMNNFLNEDFGSKTFSDLLAENGNEGSMSQSQKQEMVVDSKKEEAVDGVNFSSNFSLEPSLYDGQKSCSKGGLAQRMAKAGFNAPTINTARIRSSATSPPEIRSPYLTIPPGLSPTTLLDSPVFLSNMAQPSPTTGKISFAQGYSSNSISASAVLDKSKDENLDDIIPGGFAFKPPLNTSSSYFSTSENKGAPVIDQQQSLQSMEVSIQQHFNRPGPAGFSEPSDIKDSADDITFCPRPSDSFIGNENSPPLDDQPDTEGDPKGEYSSMAVAAPAEDGYNWRKYGQKQVKGSEYPRSYYKCTHPNCQVKKKVERSHEGHITEIIYKGAHNHPKPPPNRRSVIPSSHPFNDTQMDGSERPNYDGKRLWGGDGVEATSSASVAEFGDPAAPVQQDGSRYESPEAIDISSTLSNDEEEDDRATHGSVSLGGDGEGDETESKRRKLDASAIDMSAASRAVREPRVVVQTTSEVDILDDGYRWRKYGQKVVKGNPNPRSYYKCTNPGCNVRKHVERASHDLKAVITTYEGKHNHDVPAARNSSHSNAGPSSNAPPAPPTQPHILHRRPEQTHDGLMRFNGRPPLSTFGLPGRELNIGPGFSFGMSQQGFPNLGLGGLGPLGPMRMPVMGPIPSYMGPNRQAGGSEAGFMIPKGEPKEEPVSESGLPMSNGMTAYHQQLMSRLPLGPQL